MTARILREWGPRFVAHDKDWTKARTITAGVDIGSMSAQALVLADNDIFAYSNIRTGGDSAETASKAINRALEDTGMSLTDIHYIVGTGYGRFVIPFADKNITEISCHAKGANWFFPEVRTILDMGGQDCKAIRCDERGKVVQFLMNDKCAAGCGRSMVVMSDLLDVPLEDIGGLSLDLDKEPPALSSTCVVFAKSEALGLLRKGERINEILAAYCDGLAHRIYLLVKRIGLERDFAITGGIAKNIGVVRRVEDKLGVKARICHEPQIVGTLGAALFARELLAKRAAAA